MKKTGSKTKRSDHKNTSASNHHAQVRSAKAEKVANAPKKASPESRNAFLSKALDRYAIPFVRDVEARLIRWQATL